MREIFVFGSNLAGRHGKGAALYAAQQYGAQRGVGEGMTGNAYAIPTKGHNLETLEFAAIAASIQKFVEFARDNPGVRFLVTPVGTGLAGHSKKDVWNVFAIAGMPENCLLTSSWMESRPSRQLVSDMKLSEEEADRIAAAYHRACHQALAEKLALYHAAKTTPSLHALKPAPFQWVDAVATEVAAILHERCKTGYECDLNRGVNDECFVCGDIKR